ncbi:uncharacterized protein [Rutidosis leptorrhynchoides]|uniref:uncharacterized protein n=1 Tax=Rutidosis leptorrhynchoides TaxID=125765 RepID=UPI003A98FA77
MERNGMVLVILLLFILSPSDALISRKLVEVLDQSGGSTGTQGSPSSSPPPDDKKLNISPDAKTKPKDTPNTTPSNVDSKGLNDANNKTGSEISNGKIPDNGKSQGGKVKVENEKQSETFASKSCKGNSICSDQKKSIIACIEDFESGSNKLTLLVKNEQDTDLNVNITFGTSPSTYNNLPPFGIRGHGTEMVNITLSGDKSTKVILDAGNGGCELQFDLPKLPPVDNPSNSKDSKNTPNPKDVDNPVDSPEKPKNVDNQTKPKDTNNPEKPKEDNIPVKDNKPDNSPNPKEDSKLPINVDTPPKPPNEVNDTSKSKDVDDPSKSKDVIDPSKSKDVIDPSKSKDVDDPSKSKDVIDPSKSKDGDDPSKSKIENDPFPKPTPTIVDTPTTRNNILDQLTFYSKQVTPIYGAYFAFLVALIIGASWVLCSFRKRRTDNGVPYQELEMGLPESSNAVNVETAEGWDQDWDDDDWDEDKAITSPGGGIHSKSISSNGLTSRATKKDDWDANWDD